MQIAEQTNFVKKDINTALVFTHEGDNGRGEATTPFDNGIL